MKGLILGDGQLGTAIRKINEWNYISRKNCGFDAENPDFTWIDDYNIIINCIAFTDTYSNNKEKNWKVNYEFVSKLTDYCNETNKKLVQISTDYVYTFSKTGASEEDVPVHCATWYGYTKLLGEGYVQLKSKSYLIIRCSFKPYPFPYKRAVVNQIGNFDNTNVIAKYICELIDNNAEGIYNVGTEPKTIYELAKYSNLDVKPMFEKIHDDMPTDITMNCEKMKEKLNVTADKRSNSLL
jgi:dTDP-4-dehydrorhamnose reductase